MPRESIRKPRMPEGFPRERNGRQEALKDAASRRGSCCLAGQKSGFVYRRRDVNNRAIARVALLRGFYSPFFITTNE
jgi:hypothetical protein